MPRTSRRRWVDDVIDYLQELGGEAQYEDLYRHIERSPRRPLGTAWQAVVRRTIEEHSSDSTIWHKRKLPDLFRSVNGLGGGRWALRTDAKRNHVILRSNADSPWNDTDGQSYQFGPTVPNWTKLRAGDETIIERIVDGQHYLIGRATIGTIASDADGRFIARYSDYEGFAEPVPIPQRFAAIISALPGFNAQHSITIIPENVYTPLLEEVGAAERNRVAIEQITGPILERGGLEPPRRRAIGDKPPSQSIKQLARADPEARRQAIERRKLGHHNLVLAFRDSCRDNGFDTDCTQYADALAAGWIFEMKTVEHDAVAQVRSAIGQLYHYLFLHRHLSGYENAQLCIVLDKEIDAQLTFFLVTKTNISVIWLSPHGFDGIGPILNCFPWLFNSRV